MILNRKFLKEQVQSCKEFRGRLVTRGKLREIVEEVKSFSVENEAPTALFVLIPVGQFEFLSTVLKDGPMIGIGVSATPGSDAHRQLLFEYPRRAHICPLLHLRVMTYFCTRRWQLACPEANNRS